MRASRFQRVGWAALLLALLPQTSQAQKLRDRSKPASDPINCPYTAGDPELLAKVGVLSLGGFSFGREESTQALDEFLSPFTANGVRWLETEHFKIGFSLGTVKVDPRENKKIRAELEEVALLWPEAEIVTKTRTLDPWMRSYLFALRAEKLWDEMLALLEVEDADFPAGNTNWDTSSEYMGAGPYLGQKSKYEVLFLPSEAASRQYLRHYFGLATRLTQRWNILDLDTLHLVIHTQQGDLRKDTALHGHFVFNMSQQMLNGYKHYSYEIPVWIKEGIGHWMERRVSPRYNTFNSSEGAVAEMTRKENWEPPTRKLVTKEEFPGMARLVNLRGFSEMKLEHHFTTWSMVDYLMREKPHFLATLLGRIKGLLNEDFIPDGSGIADAQRATFREVLGVSYAQFDRAWAAWVLDNYGSK
ncbi:MAG: hypothetical protein V3T22_02505 [Planctomycetota bacterium]